MAAPTNKRKNSAKNRKTKTFLEFDEKARSEYLRGFQKRKNERRKIAREKNDQRVIEERKTLIRQFREQQKNKRAESDIIPEIKHLVNPEVYNLPEHTVTIADFGEVDFVGNTGIRLGRNTGKVGDDDDDDDDNALNDTMPTTTNVSTKSLQKKLAACSNQLSSQKLKAKKANKKQHLKAKFKRKKKGKKGQKQ